MSKNPSKQNWRRQWHGRSWLSAVCYRRIKYRLVLRICSKNRTAGTSKTSRCINGTSQPNLSRSSHLSNHPCRVCCSYHLRRTQTTSRLSKISPSTKRRSHWQKCSPLLPSKTRQTSTVPGRVQTYHPSGQRLTSDRFQRRNEDDALVSSAGHSKSTGRFTFSHMCTIAYLDDLGAFLRQWPWRGN